MAEQKSIGVNAILSGIKSALQVLFPLITFPYVSRVLQVDNIGKYNFAASINNYFILLAGLGIATYAVREGAAYRDDPEKIGVFSSEIFTINLISMAASYILLFILLAVVPKLASYRTLIIIFSIEIFFRTIGTEWIYTIFEEYGYITKRSIIFQIVSLVLLFLLVRNKDDVAKYALVTVLADAGSNIMNIIHVHKFVRFHITKNIHFKRHLKPILIIFVTTIATTLYVNSDMTILGFLSTDYHVGLYSVAVKVYTIVKTMLSSVLLVAVPRLSNYIGTGQDEKFNNTFNRILHTLLVLVFPAVTGLFSLSDDIVLIISGQEFRLASTPLKILSVSLMFCIIGWAFNACVLIPYKREKQVLIATVICALVNISLNFILIPYWEENATAMTTLLAEAISMFLCIGFSRHIVKLHIGYRLILSTVVGCLLIYSYCKLIQLIGFHLLLEIGLSVVGSIFLYATILWIFHNPVLFHIIKSIKNRIIKI